MNSRTRVAQVLILLSTRTHRKSVPNYDFQYHYSIPELLREVETFLPVAGRRALKALGIELKIEFFLSSSSASSARRVFVAVGLLLHGWRCDTDVILRGLAHGLRSISAVLSAAAVCLQYTVSLLAELVPLRRYYLMIAADPQLAKKCKTNALIKNCAPH